MSAATGPLRSEVDAAPDSGVREKRGERAASEAESGSALVGRADVRATDRRYGVEGAAWIAGGAWPPRRRA